MVLFSRSSKTIVLLELTVPLEDNVHLAHHRKTSKYSALVTACEENGFKTHMFALEVGCLGYCPHSFFHCFKALGLPKSAARQIRSEASNTALRSSYVLFFAEVCRLGNVKLFFTEPCSRRFIFSLFFFFVFCLHFLCHFRFAPFAPRDNSFRFQAYTQHPSLFDFSNCQTYTVLNAYSSFRALPSEIYQPVGCALSLLRYVASTMRVRVVDWWISLTNLQLAADFLAI